MKLSSMCGNRDLIARPRKAAFAAKKDVKRTVLTFSIASRNRTIQPRAAWRQTVLCATSLLAAGVHSACFAHDGAFEVDSSDCIGSAGDVVRSLKPSDVLIINETPVTRERVGMIPAIDLPVLRKACESMGETVTFEVISVLPETTKPSEDEVSHSPD